MSAEKDIETELRRLNQELSEQAEHLREMNQSLLDSEQRLRLAIETGKIGLWVWNSTNVANAGDWSPRLKEIFGLPADTQVTHELFLRCVHPDDRESVNRAVMDALSGVNGGEYRAEYRTIHTVDGSERWVTARAQAFFDDAGLPIRFIGTLMDITEKKREEVFLLQLNTELEESISQRTAALEQANEALRLEIEERKKAEAALKRNEDAMRLRIDAIPEMVWSCLPDGQVDFVNKRWLDYTGFTLAQACGSGLHEAIHPEDREGLADYWLSLLRTGRSGQYEARIRRHDGEFRWFLFRAEPFTDESGRTIKWYGTNTDIQDRRASEHVTRGQIEALTGMLSALTEESDSEKLLEHVARMIRDQTGAHSVSFWAKGDGDLLDPLATFDEDRLQFPLESASSTQILALQGSQHPVWNEFFRTGMDCVEGVFDTDPPLIRLANREGAEWVSAYGPPPVNPAVYATVEKVKSLGIETTLTVPMVIRGRFQGIISVRFLKKRRFRSEELALIQALASQAMLIIQMMRLSRQSRQTAVVSERNRFARDIHDTLAQGFTGVIIQLEAAEDARSQGLDAESDSHLRRARQLAADSLTEARASVHALRPLVLSGRDLCAALREIMEKITFGTALKCDLHVEGETQPLPAAWEEHLVRIGQETLTNALRHAHATRFTSRVSFSGEFLRLEFSDNGRGFDTMSSHAGFGLAGMKERVESMGGTILLRSGLDQGVSVIIVLPLPLSNHESHTFN